VLEPYEAPDCRCVVHTEFEGRLAGDRIEGTFVTTGARPGATQRGRWRVTRSREPGRGGGSR
jgi:hypothetical protein